ncbi:MAG: toprim domain-containing protein, partial [Verrucomicrobiota bacterium]|nr:toprim domain-containing protein [Verrucomicrobiota bacterium]
MSIDKELLRAAIPVERYYRDQLGEPHKTNGDHWVYPCTFHKDKNNPNLAVGFDGRVHCFACKEGGDIYWFHKKLHGLSSFPEVLEDLAGKYAPSLLNDNGNGKVSSKRDKERAHKALNDSGEDTGKVSSYLKSRGLSGAVPIALLFNPSLEYWQATEGNFKSLGCFPAIIAKITKGDSLLGIHQTWLDNDGKGKAPVEYAKKSRKISHSLSGGAIRLFDFEPGKPLILAEGIETALAISESTDWSSWSCVNAGMLERVELPKEANNIYVGADLDPVSGIGLESANKLASRLHAEGRKIHVVIPEGNEKTDWLDVFNSEGSDAVKARFLSAEAFEARELQSKGSERVGCYGIEDGQLIQFKRTRDGEDAIPLTNFSARITAEVQKDDGAEIKRCLEIEAVLHEKPYRFQVRATDFQNMNWPVSNMGASAIVYAGQGKKDHARVAIQSLSKII